MRRSPPELADRIDEVDLGPVDEVLRDDRAVVTIGSNDTSLLIIRTRRGVFAMRNECPHMGLPLADATVRRGDLTCAHHGYRYDLTSGRCRSREGWRTLPLHTYRAWIESGHVFVTPG
jgi:nitrite reductase/ring-hydroxylating ferredoxin subunit